MNEEVKLFVCDRPGMVGGDVKFTEKTNFDGEPYWVATKDVTHLLGSKIDGCVVQGFGRTKEIALERLDKDEANLYESLWY